jgi:hypothetical protein
MTNPFTLTFTAVLALILGSGAVVLLRHRRSRVTAMATGGPPGGPAILSLPPGVPQGTMPATASPAQARLARVSGLGLRDAEDLLDWLEQHGHKKSTLVCDGEELFTVEFHPKSAPKTNPAPQIQPPHSSAG